MRCTFLVAVLATAVLSACAPSTDKALLEVCVDGTCDEIASDSWYVPWCETEALAMTEAQKAMVLTLDREAEKPADRYLELSAPFCEPGEYPDAIYQCVAFPHPDSPTGLLVWPLELEECDAGDGACRVDDTGAAVCEVCYPGEEACMSLGEGPWGVYQCSNDYEWVMVLECGDSHCGKDDTDQWICTP